MIELPADPAALATLSVAPLAADFVLAPADLALPPVDFARLMLRLAALAPLPLPLLLLRLRLELGRLALLPLLLPLADLRVLPFRPRVAARLFPDPDAPLDDP